MPITYKDLFLLKFELSDAKKLYLLSQAATSQPQTTHNSLEDDWEYVASDTLLPANEDNLSAINKILNQLLELENYFGEKIKAAMKTITGDAFAFDELYNQEIALNDEANQCIQKCSGLLEELKNENPLLGKFSEIRKIIMELYETEASFFRSINEIFKLLPNLAEKCQDQASLLEINQFSSSCAQFKNEFVLEKSRLFDFEKDISTFIEECLHKFTQNNFKKNLHQQLKIAATYEKFLTTLRNIGLHLTEKDKILTESLQFFAIQPVQRSMRYPLLLKELEKKIEFLNSQENITFEKIDGATLLANIIKELDAKIRELNEVIKSESREQLKALLTSYDTNTQLLPSLKTKKELHNENLRNFLSDLIQLIKQIEAPENLYNFFVNKEIQSLLRTAKTFQRKVNSDLDMFRKEFDSMEKQWTQYIRENPSILLNPKLKAATEKINEYILKVNEFYKTQENLVPSANLN